MGVINLTPNSFSNGGVNFTDSSNAILLEESLNAFLKIPHLIFDFGLESTAPMNSKITSELERERFFVLMEYLKKVDLNKRWISFDTYRPANYRFFESEFKKHFRDCGFIFNDVSGVIDGELLDLLNEKKNDSSFYYIYNCAHIPSREVVLEHMKFIKEENIILTAQQNFQQAIDQFKSYGVEERIIFDPGFGFSKSFDQNWELINNFDQLVKLLKDSGIKRPWLIGLSKKSFLRKALGEVAEPFSASEILHAEIIEQFIKNNKKEHLLFRVHDPYLVEGVYARL